jgi:hypothetical protein
MDENISALFFLYIKLGLFKPILQQSVQIHSPYRLAGMIHVVKADTNPDPLIQAFFTELYST